MNQQINLVLLLALICLLEGCKLTKLQLEEGELKWPESGCINCTQPELTPPTLLLHSQFRSLELSPLSIGVRTSPEAPPQLLDCSPSSQQVRFQRSLKTTHQETLFLKFRFPQMCPVASPPLTRLSPIWEFPSSQETSFTCTSTLLALHRHLALSIASSQSCINENEAREIKGIPAEAASEVPSGRVSLAEVSQTSISQAKGALEAILSDPREKKSMWKARPTPGTRDALS